MAEPGPAAPQRGGILYALVARGGVVLAEHSDVAGNSGVVALDLLAKVPSDDGFRASWAAGQHVFHVQSAGGLTYLCMAEESLGTRLPFAFLADVRQQFEARHVGAAATAAAYELNADFAPTLRERARFFSTDPRADALSRVRGEVADLKNVMVDNIDKVLGRGERLDLLVEKTDEMGQQAFAFKRQARVLRRRMWMQGARLTAVIVALVLLAVYVIICAVCSPTFQC